MSSLAERVLKGPGSLLISIKKKQQKKTLKIKSITGDRPACWFPSTLRKMNQKKALPTYPSSPGINTHTGDTPLRSYNGTYLLLLYVSCTQRVKAPVSASGRPVQFCTQNNKTQLQKKRINNQQSCCFVFVFLEQDPGLLLCCCFFPSPSP